MIVSGCYPRLPFYLSRGNDKILKQKIMLHNMKNIIKGAMTLGKMTTKRVWLGTYFNHYNAIVIFSEKPFYSTEEDLKGCVDLIDKRIVKITVGSIPMDVFQDLFPGADISELIQENGNVIDMEPSKLIQMDMTAPWDEYGKLPWIDFHFDGYGK